MNCPDTERILDLALKAGMDPAAEAHLANCEDCRRSLRLVQELRAAFDPGMEVPAGLVDSTVELMLGTPVTEEAGSTVWDVSMAGVLGAVTVLVTAIATGSVGSSGLPVLLSLALLGAVASGGWEYRHAQTVAA